MTSLHIRQDAPKDGHYPIRLTLKRAGQPDHEAEARIDFALTEQEQEDLRWYLEDYLQHVEAAEAVTVQQVESLMKTRGEELYTKVLAANADTQALWFSIRNDLADLRVEIATGIAEAASIPWELMRDPQIDSPISLRVKSFVRVQSNPNISFVHVPLAEAGQVRLLYIACRPGGPNDVELRAVANRLLQDLGENRARFDIKALRPPTFEQLQKELADAKQAGHPYHIVHFDGHGIYADLSNSTLADWTAALSAVTLGGGKSGKHGYLLFEHPSEDKMRPVDGQTLGQLLHDSGVPILVLNACQSAMHEAAAAPKTADSVHDEIRAVGSLTQAVIDQGIPAVLGMRYSVYVVTAAQYIGQLYAALAKGRSFGRAATDGRKHLYHNPERWIGLQPRPLQDWFVPVVHEPVPIHLFPTGQHVAAGEQPELDPVQNDRALRRNVPEEGFIGRDETILALDRAFDSHRVVLLHAYAGQGKSSTAVEFARWYALTGGLGKPPIVFFASFEIYTDLNDLLNRVGQSFAPLLESRSVHWNALNDTAKRLAAVKKLLREFPILWIWDNVEPVAGFPEGIESQWTTAEQDDLRDFLKQIKLDSDSKVKILLTSRRDEHGWLGAIPYRIAMPRMRNSDAAKLALKLGEEKGLKPSQIADWQPLLDYCSGNPLTLRVLVGQAIRMKLRGKEQIERFVDEIRSGEQRIEDADKKQGRDKSLGASLDYGFRNAFKDDELPTIALLHLFQGAVNTQVLQAMGSVGGHALPELKGKTKEHFTALLKRAKDIGLLTPIGPDYFAIHPALPWFLRQLFARHFDGRDGHSTAQAARRAWVEAVGALGSYSMREFTEGEPNMLTLIEVEEANFLEARRLARRNQWWDRVISSMQGLRPLYEHQGRLSEWARLVQDIWPDFCTEDGSPIPGREEDYGLVMSYRVLLAMDNEHDLAKAAALQKKLVTQRREQAATVLALPTEAPLDILQRYRLRELATSLGTLGQILSEGGDPGCIAYYRECAEVFRRIGDKAGESVTEFNLGYAYSQIPEIYDLDAATAAYARGLDLCAPNDKLSRAKHLQSIGIIHYQRFLNAGKRRDPEEALRTHAQEALTHLLQAIQLCPPSALTAFAPMHNSLGNLYTELGGHEDARKHFELAAQLFKRARDHFHAGQVRYNLAATYYRASIAEPLPALREGNLRRARAYAESALSDFQSYQDRATKEKAIAQRLLHDIDQALANLPPQAIRSS